MNFEMGKTQFVVRDLNVLIDTYGIDVVKHALNYIDTFPGKPAIKQYHFKNTQGADFFLTQEEFNRIESTYPKVNKIQAIKMFREITSCGLKEAKDAIESYYDIGYRY